jgi:hypothetical protein
VSLSDATAHTQQHYNREQCKGRWLGDGSIAESQIIQHDSVSTVRNTLAFNILEPCVQDLHVAGKANELIDGDILFTETWTLPIKLLLIPYTTSRIAA